jgi:hypothetical protein
MLAIIAMGATIASAKENNKGKNKSRANKTCVCHIPPGNPDNAHTICIGAPAVAAHLAHGDTVGACAVDTSCEPVACGGSTGTSCAIDQFCMRSEGSCAPDTQGTCTEIPLTCPTLSNPVCGCDGVTYMNACFAQAAGMTVQHAGACTPGVACGGEGGAACPTGQFCKPPVGVCTAGAAGNCAPIPPTPICSPSASPVCGCDGTTYLNSCLADAAGVAVDHAGECAADVQVCGGGAPACPTGEFCSRPAGSGCDPAVQGVCQTTPTVCPAVVEPVCGCNGTTYDNACLADVAGVQIAGQGACQPQQACGGPSGTTCDTGEFCKKAVASCAPDAAGVCTDTPLSCPTALAPVCGCDGNTYNNACLADAAGVTVNHTGACP